jgi:hypothetical protein
MGDIADMMIDGTLDSQTGEYIGPGPGYPRTIFGRHRYGYNHKHPKTGVVKYLRRKFPEMEKKEFNQFCFNYVQEKFELDELNKNNRDWNFLAHKIQKNFKQFIDYCNDKKTDKTLP